MSSKYEQESWEEVLELLKKKKVLKTERVQKVMLAVNRAFYCPRFPFRDEPQDIGFRSWICAPHMHAFILEVLQEKLQEGGRALDVGSGSGYLTACMAKLVGPTGLVIGVDHIKELATTSVKNVTDGNYELLKTPTVRMYFGDGRNGVLKHAPYDVIFVGAVATYPPKNIFAQLKVGGRLLIPIYINNVNQVLTIFDKISPGAYKRIPTAKVAYSPLTERVKQWPWNSSKECIDISYVKSVKEPLVKKLSNNPTNFKCV